MQEGIRELVSGCLNFANYRRAVGALVAECQIVVPNRLLKRARYVFYKQVDKWVNSSNVVE